LRRLLILLFVALVLFVISFIIVFRMFYPPQGVTPWELVQEPLVVQQAVLLCKDLRQGVSNTFPCEDVIQ
jgi:hypothetical protein